MAKEWKTEHPAGSTSETASAEVGKSDDSAPKPVEIGFLVEEFSAPLYRYAYRLSGSDADAEDLVQQVFLVAHQKLGQLRELSRARAWLFTILRNTFFKQRERRQPVLADNIQLDIESIESSVVEDDIDRELLQAAIDELPDPYKSVIVMYYFEQTSYKEIAESLEIAPGTVMSRLSRAKSHLRDRLFHSHLDNQKQSD